MSTKLDSSVNDIRENRQGFDHHNDSDVSMESKTEKVLDKLVLKNVNIWYDNFQAIKNVSMRIPERHVTAFIGPSGCGKSTLLRALNRMNDEIVVCRTTGEIFWRGINILDKNVDPVALRRKVGMVFQKPNPFPKSVFENVAYGPRIDGIRNRKML